MPEAHAPQAPDQKPAMSIQKTEEEVQETPRENLGEEKKSPVQKRVEKIVEENAHDEGFDPYVGKLSKKGKNAAKTGYEEVQAEIQKTSKTREQTAGEIRDQVKGTRAALREEKKSVRAQIRRDLVAKYKSSKSKILNNQEFKDELREVLSGSDGLERINLERKLLSSFDRSARNDLEKEALEREIQAITGEEVEIYKSQLLENIRRNSSGEEDYAKKAKRVYSRSSSFTKRTIATRKLKENHLKEQEAAKASEKVQAVVQQEVQAGSTEVSAEDANLRADDLTQKVKKAADEQRAGRVRRILQKLGKGIKSSGKTVQKVMAATIIAVALQTGGAPLLANFSEMLSKSPIHFTLETAKAEAPEHKHEEAAPPASSKPQLDKETNKPEESQTSGQVQKDTPEKIEARRQESLRIIGGQERLLKIQEVGKSFTKAMDEYLHLKFKVGDKEYFVAAGFGESEGYPDFKGNRPFMWGRASASDLQGSLDQLKIQYPDLFNAVRSQQDAEVLVKEKLRLVTDCAGLVGGVTNVAGKDLGIGSLHNNVGIEAGNLSATQFLRLGQQTKGGYEVVDDKAKNLLLPGTIIVFTKKDNPNEAVHATVIESVHIDKDGRLRVIVDENTDVNVVEGDKVERIAKGSHRFEIILLNPEERLSEQAFEGVYYDFGQLLIDDRVKAVELARIQTNIDISDFTPEQARSDPRLQDVSYGYRFSDMNYRIIRNNNIVKLVPSSVALQEEYDKIDAWKGAVV